jgi:flagellar assembly protein FliH
MSSRARRILEPAAVEPFDWGAPPPEAQPDPAPAPPPAPAAPSPAEMEARLAALEREAFAKGYAQGERAGLEAGAKRTEAMLRRVAQTIEELAGLRQTIVRETERQMVQLALLLARKVVTRELAMDPDLVAAMAHVAVARLGESTPATIRLNPEDYAVVTAGRGPGWAGAQVQVVPDASVARGGCLVESEFGLVDGTLDAQFAELTRALLGEAAPVVPVPAGRDE